MTRLLLLLPVVAFLSACDELALEPDPDDLRAALGEACGDSILCAEGYCDATGVCVVFSPDGQACDASTECASGLCSPAGICGRKGGVDEPCPELGCASGLYCDINDLCRTLRADGIGCNQAGQCLSGQCVDQLCEPRELCAPFEPIGYPSVTEACDLGVTSPSRFAITTTDFSTGAISSAEIATRETTDNLAVASSDAAPYHHDGLVYVVHRFGQDYIDVRDPDDDFALLGQYAVAAEEVATTNPHAVAFGSDGLGFVTLFGHHQLYVYDFARTADEALVDRVDLRRFADADGRPEASLTFACGDILFVGLQRLDTSTFTPVDCDLLVAIDTSTRDAFYSPIPLLGTWAKQARPVPGDPTSAFILTTGIERVDLQSGEVSWEVPASLFAARGMGSYELLSFDLTSDGDTFYVAATSADFTVDIWRVNRAGIQSLEKVITGLNAIERTLEVIGSELWFGDRTLGASGMRVYDLDSDPVTELAGPLGTGLPPYCMVPIP